MWRLLVTILLADHFSNALFQLGRRAALAGFQEGGAGIEVPRTRAKSATDADDRRRLIACSGSRLPAHDSNILAEISGRRESVPVPANALESADRTFRGARNSS